MNAETKKEKASLHLFFACWIAYMTVCMTKINYVASIAFIVKEGIFSKSDSGLISAAFYLCYGISQLLGGRTADKLSPYLIMSIGLAGSAVTNGLLIFTNNFRFVLILWSLTGLIQFGVWPSAARIVSGVLITEHRMKASVYITLALAAGGILSYSVITLILNAFGWSGVFTLNAIALIAAFVVWKYTQKRTENILISEPPSILNKKSFDKTDTSFKKLFFSSPLFLVLLMGIFQALLDNGVKSWVPTMMMESYELSPVWASMQTAIIYIVNIFGVVLLVRIFKKTESPVLLQTFYFIICIPACVLLSFTGKLPIWLAFICLLVMTTATYAMTNINVRIASAFNKYGCSATVSGIINAAVCFGVVLGNWGYGVIAENFGWSCVTALWLVVCIAAVLAGIPASLMWKRFKKSGM